jgi:hypothetical protein
MRNAAVYAGLLATTFASLGQAMVNLTILSPVDDIRFNDGILVEWATDKTYVRPPLLLHSQPQKADSLTFYNRVWSSISSRKKTLAGLSRKTSSMILLRRLARVTSL